WEVKDLKDFFISNVLDIAERYSVKIGGWQEIINGLSAKTSSRLKKSLFMVNCWNTVPSWGTGDIPYILANNDYPVILSNVLNTYADQAYSPSRYEIAHSWAGYLEEKDSFSLLPYDVCQSRRDSNGVPDSSSGEVHLRKPENNKGVQVQLFSETIRSFDDLTYDLLPKIIGVFERGWNATPDWQEGTPEEFQRAFDKYYSIIIKNEMPYWASEGFRFHVPQPGIARNENNDIITNSAIPGAKIKLSTKEGISAYTEFLGERSMPTGL
ncbi:MAG: family 20 glycosylhydrolase, partial [Bacteroidales bacterium]|nr:family 20 glycosylhydrolase [Bacteroidales bacterium]